MRMGPDLFNLCEPPRVSVFVEPPLGGPTDDDRLVVVRIHAAGYPARVARKYVSRYAPEALVFEQLARMFTDLAAWEEWPTQAQFVNIVGEFLLEVPPF